MENYFAAQSETIYLDYIERTKRFFKRSKLFELFFKKKSRKNLEFLKI